MPSDATGHHSGRFAPAFLTADRSAELVDLTIGQLLKERASESPDRMALIGARHGSDTVERLTYAQLYQEAGAALSAVTEPVDFVAVWAPNVKVPARWFVVDQFPTTPTGKVQRFALRGAALSEELREL